MLRVRVGANEFVRVTSSVRVREGSHCNLFDGESEFKECLGNAVL